MSDMKKNPQAPMVMIEVLGGVVAAVKVSGGDAQVVVVDYDNPSVDHTITEIVSHEVMSAQIQEAEAAAALVQDESGYPEIDYKKALEEMGTTATVRIVRADGNHDVSILCDDGRPLDVSMVSALEREAQEVYQKIYPQLDQDAFDVSIRFSAQVEPEVTIKKDDPDNTQGMTP